MRFLQFAKDYGKFLLKDKRGFWPAVIAGAAALGSSAINYAAQDKANDKSIELWREQAQWNKPINQMARYQEAGLNPNLVYSQGNPGNLASSPTIKASQVDLDVVGALQLDASLKNMREQNKNLQASNLLLQSQTSFKNEETRRLAIENDWLEKTGSSPLESPEFRSLRGLLSDSSMVERFAEFLGTLRGNVDVMFSPRVRRKLDNSRRYEQTFKTLRSR